MGHRASREHSSLVIIKSSITTRGLAPWVLAQSSADKSSLTMECSSTVRCKVLNVNRALQAGHPCPVGPNQEVSISG